MANPSMEVLYYAGSPHRLGQRVGLRDLLGIANGCKNTVPSAAWPSGLPPGVLECVCGLYSNDLSAHQQGEPPPES